MATPVYAGSLKDLFVSINLNSGHDQDMEGALEEALSGRVTYDIFHRMQREPQHVFDVTVRAIVLCKGALFDASPIAEQMRHLDPDVLIQFGISYAMGKEVLLVSVPEQYNGAVQPSVTEGYTKYYASYTELATTLRIGPLEWREQYRYLEERQTEYNPRNIMSFSVFGATAADVRDAIRAFVRNTGWRPVFSRQVDSRTNLQILASEIGQRSFCIFCLGQSDEETLVSLGLAIGMGVPFILIHEKGTQLPDTLRGYHATLGYEQYTEIKQQLSSDFREVFLDPAIIRWKDSTFRRLSSWGDDLVKTAKTKDGLKHAEKVFEAIIASTSNPIPEPHAGLGDALLARYYGYEGDSLDLLRAVKQQYERALGIDPEFIRCKNGIEVVDRQIEILELLRHGKYKSISSLIRMIGDDLTSEQYAQIRNFLLKVIKALMGMGDYKNALALLLAMQRHDKSEEIENLIQKVLALAPGLLREAYHEAQEHITQLESRIRNLTSELEQLGSQVRSLEKQLEKATQDAPKTARQMARLQELNSRLEEHGRELQRSNDDLRRESQRSEVLIGSLRERINELELHNEDLRRRDEEQQSELSDVRRQLAIIEQINVSLKRAKDDLEDKVGPSLASEVKAQSCLGRAALVNLRGGWGIYSALEGEPYILRGDRQILPQKGELLQHQDVVVDAGGHRWKITYGYDFPWGALFS